jgi:hypothetical protein
MFFVLRSQGGAFALHRMGLPSFRSSGRGHLALGEGDQALHPFTTHRTVGPGRRVGARRDAELPGDVNFHPLERIRGFRNEQSMAPRHGDHLLKRGFVSVIVCKDLGMMYGDGGDFAHVDPLCFLI